MYSWIAIAKEPPARAPLTSEEKEFLEKDREDVVKALYIFENRVYRYLWFCKKYQLREADQQGDRILKHIEHLKSEIEHLSIDLDKETGLSQSKQI